jgi:polysaccharide deacetylase family protein (PEP-CTERM system associated)
MSGHERTVPVSELFPGSVAAFRAPDLTDKNFLTFDIEEWYHVNYPGIDTSGYREKPTNLEPLVERLIDICGQQGVRTTCFILGDVGRQTPAVVKKLHANGHEIASHGCAHESIYPMTPDQFSADLKLSCDILQNLTGEKIVGFRAPSFSVKQETLQWFYPTLESLGLRYSSSVFPGQTFLYGIPDFPERVHYPVVNGVTQKILEFPVPRIELLGKHMGLYIRLFPAWMIRRKILADNRRGRPVILYVHPREIDVDQPRLPLQGFEKLIHYWGIRTCEDKLRTLLSDMPSRLCAFRDVLPASAPAGRG